MICGSVNIVNWATGWGIQQISVMGAEESTRFQCQMSLWHSHQETRAVLQLQGRKNRDKSFFLPLSFLLPHLLESCLDRFDSCSWIRS